MSYEVVAVPSTAVLQLLDTTTNEIFDVRTNVRIDVPRLNSSSSGGGGAAAAAAATAAASSSSSAPACIVCEPYALEARDVLRKNFIGRPVDIEEAGVHFIVTRRDGETVPACLLKRGLARLSDKFAKPHRNDTFGLSLLEAQEEAQRQRLGLWAAPEHRPAEAQAVVQYPLLRDELQREMLAAELLRRWVRVSVESIITTKEQFPPQQLQQHPAHHLWIFGAVIVASAQEFRFQIAGVVGPVAETLEHAGRLYLLRRMMHRVVDIKIVGYERSSHTFFAAFRDERVERLVASGLAHVDRRTLHMTRSPQGILVAAEVAIKEAKGCFDPAFIAEFQQRQHTGTNSGNNSPASTNSGGGGRRRGAAPASKSAGAAAAAAAAAVAAAAAPDSADASAPPDVVSALSLARHDWVARVADVLSESSLLVEFVRFYSLDKVQQELLAAAAPSSSTVAVAGAADAHPESAPAAASASPTTSDKKTVLASMMVTSSSAAGSDLASFPTQSSAFQLSCATTKLPTQAELNEFVEQTGIAERLWSERIVIHLAFLHDGSISSSSNNNNNGSVTSGEGIETVTTSAAALAARNFLRESLLGEAVLVRPFAQQAVPKHAAATTATTTLYADILLRRPCFVSRNDDEADGAQQRKETMETSTVVEAMIAASASPTRRLYPVPLPLSAGGQIAPPPPLAARMAAWLAQQADGSDAAFERSLTITKISAAGAAQLRPEHPLFQRLEHEVPSWQAFVSSMRRGEGDESATAALLSDEQVAEARARMQLRVVVERCDDAALAHGEAPLDLFLVDYGLQLPARLAFLSQSAEPAQQQQQQLLEAMLQAEPLLYRGGLLCEIVCFNQHNVAEVILCVPAAAVDEAAAVEPNAAAYTTALEQHDEQHAAADNTDQPQHQHQHQQPQQHYDDYEGDGEAEEQSLQQQMEQQRPLRGKRKKKRSGASGRHAVESEPAVAAAEPATEMYGGETANMEDDVGPPVDPSFASGRDGSKELVGLEQQQQQQLEVESSAAFAAPLPSFQYFPAVNHALLSLGIAAFTSAAPECTSSLPLPLTHSIARAVLSGLRLAVAAAASSSAAAAATATATRQPRGKGRRAQTAAAAAAASGRGSVRRMPGAVPVDPTQAFPAVVFGVTRSGCVLLKNPVAAAPIEHALRVVGGMPVRRWERLQPGQLVLAAMQPNAFCAIQLPVQRAVVQRLLFPDPSSVPSSDAPAAAATAAVASSADGDDDADAAAFNKQIAALQAIVDANQPQQTSRGGAAAQKKKENRAARMRDAQLKIAELQAARAARQSEKPREAQQQQHQEEAQQSGVPASSEPIGCTVSLVDSADPDSEFHIYDLACIRVLPAEAELGEIDAAQVEPVIALMTPTPLIERCFLGFFAPGCWLHCGGAAIDQLQTLLFGHSVSRPVRVLMLTRDEALIEALDEDDEAAAPLLNVARAMRLQHALFLSEEGQSLSLSLETVVKHGLLWMQEAP